MKHILKRRQVGQSEKENRTEHEEGKIEYKQSGMKAENQEEVVKERQGENRLYINR